jgi:hypothetical protein
VDAITYLDRGGEVGPLVAAAGEDAWLRAEVRKKLASAYTDVTATSDIGEALSTVRGARMAILMGMRVLVILEDWSGRWDFGSGWPGTLLVEAEAWDGPGTVIECNEQSEGSVIAWAARKLGNKGVAEALVRRTGPKVGLVMTECDKLIASGAVSADGVASLVGDAREVKIWGITKAMGKGLGESVKFAQEYLASVPVFERQGESVHLIAKVIDRARTALAFVGKMKAGVPTEDAIKGIDGRDVKDVIEIAKRVGRRGKVDVAYDVLVRADESVKVGDDPETILLGLLSRLLG